MSCLMPTSLVCISFFYDETIEKVEESINDEIREYALKYKNQKLLLNNSTSRLITLHTTAKYSIDFLGVSADFSQFFSKFRPDRTFITICKCYIEVSLPIRIQIYTFR